MAAIGEFAQFIVGSKVSQLFLKPGACVDFGLQVEADLLTLRDIRLNGVKAT
jgi:hypothetical protein